MKVIAYVQGNSGPSYHRVIVPLASMDNVDKIFSGQFILEHFDPAPDLVIWNRSLGDDYFEDILKLRKKLGFAIAIDIDDIWHLDEHHVLYKSYIKEKEGERQIRQVRQADVIMTTHHRLAEYIHGFNPNVHIIPNAIPHGGQFAVNKVESEFMRLFWQGSNTHEEDLKLLHKPIEQMRHVSIATKIKMVLGGYVRYQENGVPKTKEECATEEQWNRMALMFTAGAKLQYKLLAQEPVVNYYSMYAHADVCLVPLINSFFNRMKSNLKVLEAGHLGLPCIVSEVHPYLGLPVRYCSRERHWVEHVKELIKNPGLRQEEGQKLKEYCAKFFNFKEINEERRQVLEYTYKNVRV